MCCCNKLFYLGCLDACSDTIIFGAGAVDYTTLNIRRGDNVQQVAGELKEGGISFTLSDLMSGYTYELWLTKEDGTKYADENGNDCYIIDAINFYS